MTKMGRWGWIQDEHWESQMPWVSDYKGNRQKMWQEIQFLIPDKNLHCGVLDFWRKAMNVFSPTNNSGKFKVDKYSCIWTRSSGWAQKGNHLSNLFENFRCGEIKAYVKEREGQKWINKVEKFIENENSNKGLENRFLGRYQDWKQSILHWNLLRKERV